jgi:dihydroxy-acid dehydratase
VTRDFENGGAAGAQATDRDALRSARWFDGRDVAGFVHRTALRAEGLSTSAFRGKPVIGICNSWSELVNCNVHFRALGRAIARGVLQAGGLPLEFPTISLGEQLMKPTTMLYRNLMAMDVEESLRSYPIDAAVLLAGCDKTIPAQLMGAASADIPAVMVTGGPATPAMFRGRQLGVGTDLWRYTDDLRAGRMTQAEYDELEACAAPSAGHCPELGTASTMAIVVEALGMSLPGSATPPAGDARRYAAAEAAGRRAVEIAGEQLRPSRILTPAAFDNAITALVATGGSTNAVVHLLALAGRAGIELGLDRFDEIARRTPVILNLRPAGEHLVEQLFRAGGAPAVLRELASLLDVTAPTVSGAALGKGFADRETDDRDVIASIDDPFKPTGGLAVVRGSLAPRGAIVKRTVGSERLMRHSGSAVVFDDIDDLAARIDDPSLPVDASSVLVLRNAGPRGGPGMPEWGQLPIPERLLRAGVQDMVRVSDARMSGTAFGTTVLHVSPEGAHAGPLAVVQTGDRIELDVDARRIDLAVESRELERRLERWSPSPPRYDRGYGALYLEHVMQADEGCDFDFLRGRSTNPAQEPYGVVGGPIGGW